MPTDVDCELPAATWHLLVALVEQELPRAHPAAARARLTTRVRGAYSLTPAAIAAVQRIIREAN